MKASIVITTKNRRVELYRSIASAMEQQGDIEVLVIDDGSNDGTSEMIRSEFPGARLYRLENSVGYIAARNLGSRVAKGEVIFSIDDDAAFSSPDTVSEALLGFLKPCVGAVAIPYIDIAYGHDVKQVPPDHKCLYATREFRGTAHAVLKSAFTAVGGYREDLERQCEEVDLCIRLLDRGYLTLLVQAAPIHHYESLKRNWRTIHLYGRRNDLLVVWWNYPTPELLCGFWSAIVNGLRIGKHRKCIAVMLQGMAWGLVSILKSSKQRQAVSSNTFVLWRKFLVEGVIPYNQVLAHLKDS